jgi:hypothetical protein
MTLKFICLTPVKDEAWILERFLRCAALWADHIIVADQGSSDGSREIARRHPKVTVIDNPSPAYDEGARQRLLLEAARRIPGPSILIALDADEILTANWADSPEWQTVRASRPGTVILFQWANVCPDLETCWVQPEDRPWGFVDDGSEHRSRLIHNDRLPLPAGAPSLLLREVKVLHYQYTDWQRMESKQRWYQCWERLNQPRRPAQIYRQYHFMHAFPAAYRRPIRPEWFDGYRRAGIDMTTIRQEATYRWDRQVLQMLADHGARTFRRVDIWDVDWRRLAKRAGLEGDFGDPQGWVDRAVLSWLRATQDRYTRPLPRLFQWLLRFVGW